MTNFTEMMEKMMEQYMEKMMEATMMKMMSSMMPSTPEVAKAEVAQKAPTMTVEELLSLEAEEDAKAIAKHNNSLKPLEFICEDFKPKNGRKYHKGLKYNKFVASKAVWTYNHITIKEHYPAIKYSNGYYYADTLHDLQAFASSYHVVEKLNDEQLAKVHAYWDSKKKNC